MSSSANRIRSAYIELQQKKLYQTAVSSTTDIRQIAELSNMSYEATIGELEEIIRLSRHSKKWNAFKGAYVDRAEGRIVLAIPPDELIVCIPGRIGIVFVEILSIIFTIIILILLIVFKLELQTVIISAILWALLAYLLIVNRIRNSRGKKYIRLLSGQNVMAIRDIAGITKIPVELVRKDLQGLIDNDIFINARIDQKADTIVIVSSNGNSANQNNNLKMKGVSSYQAAIESYIEPDKLKNLYQIVLNDTTDIRKIAALSKMSYEETAGLLEHIIESTKNWYSFPKDWRAFKGAYINYEEKRIVLAIPQDELIIKGDGMVLVWILRIMGYTFGLTGLIFPFIFKPEWSPESNFGTVVIVCLLIAVLSAGLVLLSHFDVPLKDLLGSSKPLLFDSYLIGGNRIKRLRKYVRLISDERMTSLTDIAHAIRKPVEFVRKDLQKNIDLELMVNARIDPETDKIVIVSSKNST